MLRRFTAIFMPKFTRAKIQWLNGVLNRSSKKFNMGRTVMVHCYTLQCSLVVQRFIINQMLSFKQSLINNYAAQMITRSNFCGTKTKPVLNFEADVKRRNRIFTCEMTFIEP